MGERSYLPIEGVQRQRLVDLSRYHERPWQASGVEEAQTLAYVILFFIPDSDQIKCLALLTTALS
jgi:hypothetical protein